MGIADLEVLHMTDAVPRTFKLKSPAMKGKDVKAWEEELVELFAGIGIKAPIVSNGVYGDVDRSYTTSLCYALGLDANKAMEKGVTPELRSKLRHRHLSNTEQARFEKRVEWRRRLRERYRQFDEEDVHVSLFVAKMVADSWGYHPGVHDGVDIITLPDVPIFAPVRSKIIDVRANGWWRLGAPSDPVLRAKGDGIVQLEVLEDVGPFKKGHHIGLGHAEKARVKVGDIVKAGEQVAHAGFANAWHIHTMYNDGSTMRGIGNINPQEIIDYSIAHARK
jgi:hypothetical protein